MMVPRVFAYKPSKPSPPNADVSANDEKRPLRQQSPPQNVRGFGWRPASFRQEEQHLHKKPQTPGTSTSDPVCRDVPSTGSADAKPKTLATTQPVAVPSRRQNPQSQPSASLPVRKARNDACSTSRDRSRDCRNVPSSVAAVLASTSIPRRTSFPKKPSNAHSSQPISIDELVEEWKQADHLESSSLGTSPAMEMLLSPPDEVDEDPLADADDESFGSPRRTLSNHSMLSLDDSNSSQSGISFSVPSTPGTAGVSVRGRERVVSSSQTVDAGSDHPLHSDKDSPRHDDHEEMEDMVLPLPSLRARSPSTRKTPAKSTGSMTFAKQAPASFRSNLTASLKGLRSNLSRTFSNFSAPSSSVSVDHLTQSFLGGAPYHPEMRPRPMSGPPDSRLRRYMNPHAFQPYDFHLHNHAIHDADLEIVAAANAAAAHARALGDPDARAAAPDALDAIPMEAFAGRGGKSSTAAATEAGRARSASSGQQARREPRENPEFLRIAVLELQMRRAGKTEGPPVGFGAGLGRRGWWLAPRELSDEGAAGEYRKKGDVPARWAGTLAGE